MTAAARVYVVPPGEVTDRETFEQVCASGLRAVTVEAVLPGPVPALTTGGQSVRLPSGQTECLVAVVDGPDCHQRACLAVERALAGGTGTTGGCIGLPAPRTTMRERMSEAGFGDRVREVAVQLAATRDSMVALLEAEGEAGLRALLMQLDRQLHPVARELARGVWQQLALAKGRQDAQASRT